MTESSTESSLDCFIFDFDGTLAHSEPAYSEAFAHSIRVHTGIEARRDDLRSFWNVTPHEVLGRYSDELLDEMFVSFEEHYYATHHAHLVPYEGITELLSALRVNGSRIAVVSLKPRRAGELELDIIGLRSFIDVAVWGDDVAEPKPNPEGALRAITRLDSDPSRTLVVGDSPLDIRMGRAAGARTAAALWCGIGSERLLAEHPDLILNSPGDLLGTINQS